MTDLTALKSDALHLVDTLSPQLISISHQIHANPELAFEEHKSAATLADAAEAAGLAVTRAAYGQDTAFSADFGAASGPRIGILSEYDALPGIGHACGHNIIAAIGLGTSLALHGLGARLPGGVRYLGTPAEERGCGKELMARHGAFDGLDAAMMLHPAGINAKATRTMCISEVRATFHGRSAHAAVYPEGGRNALDAATIAYIAIGQLRQHMTNTSKVHGIMEKGGLAPNIVPDHTRLSYFIRALNAPELDALKKRVENCFQAGALATGCELELTWSEADYLDMKVNLSLADTYEAHARTLGREFIPYDILPLGGTDMSNVSHRLPVLHPLIACAPSNVMIHDPAFAKWAGSESGDQAIIDGTKALVMTALDFLGDENLRHRARSEFEATAAQSATAIALAFNPSGAHGAAGCGCC